MPQIFEDRTYESRSQTGSESSRPLHIHNHSLRDAPGGGGSDHQARAVVDWFHGGNDGGHAPIVGGLIRQSAAAVQNTSVPGSADSWRLSARGEQGIGTFRSPDRCFGAESSLRQYGKDPGIKNDKKSIE